MNTSVYICPIVNISWNKCKQRKTGTNFCEFFFKNDILYRYFHKEKKNYNFVVQTYEILIE